jgi:hypothetical protein
VDEVAGKGPIVCGVYEDGTNKAAKIAKMAEREGASCLLAISSETASTTAMRNNLMAFPPHHLLVSLPFPRIEAAFWNGDPHADMWKVDHLIDAKITRETQKCISFVAI